MTATTIFIDTPDTKRGIRAGWDIDVHAGGPIDSDPWVHVWITPPRGQRIVLRYEKVPASEVEDSVRRGWTLAIEEIDARRQA